MSWWQQGAASTTGACQRDRAGQRLVGGGVAGVQRQHDLGRLRRARASRMVPTTKSASAPASRPSPSATRLLWSRDCSLTSTPTSRTGSPRDRGAGTVGGEGEVGVAAAEVDHPQRVVGGGAAQVALGEGVGDRGVEQPQELLDLAVLGLPARLDPPSLVGEAERAKSGSSARQQPLLVAVVAAVDLDLGLGAAVVCSSASRFLVTRSWWVSVVVSTCQLPNGSSSRASTARAPRRHRPRGCAVCAWVASYAVTWRWRPALRST